MDKPFTENRVTPSTVQCRTHIGYAVEHFHAAHWYGTKDGAPKHPIPHWHEKYHFGCGVAELEKAVLALGYTLTPIQADAAAASVSGTIEDNDTASVGGGESPTQSPVLAADCCPDCGRDYSDAPLKPGEACICADEAVS